MALIQNKITKTIPKLLRRKKTIILIITLLLVIGGIYYWQTQKNQSGYIFDSVKRAAISEIVSDSGKINSEGNIDIKSPTNGIIQELYVENNRNVNEGDDLFKVKSTASIQEQQTALASYQSAVAALNAAKTLLHTYRSDMYTNWKTFTDMATNSTYENENDTPDEDARKSAEFQSAQDDWLAAEKKYIDQTQAVAAAQAQVSSAWTSYQTTRTSTVKAPMDGIINNLSVSVGDSVNAQNLLNPVSAPVLTIVNSPKIQAVLNIGQTDIAKIKTGQKVKIYPDAYKDKELLGKVIRVDSLGQDIQGVINYKVYIELDKDEDMLRPGMTIDADVITKTISNILTVPNSAVILYKNSKAVRILVNNKIIYIPVKVGIKGDTRTQIISGINEGQQIISALTNEKAARQSFLGL